MASRLGTGFMSVSPVATGLWFAHSLEGRPEGEWELLRRHLSEARREAGARAAKFGAENLGAAAGLLHDLGKYKAEFLAYIRGQGKSPDHASAGANYARARLGRPGLVLAHAIAGHHAGLKDRLFAEGARLQRTQPELARIQASAREDGLMLPESLPSPDGFQPDSAELGFQFAFLTRMLFSCLIDADRTVTRAFYADPEERRRDATPRASTAELAAALMKWMESKAEQRAAAGEADRPVNRLRDEVLRHALGRAGEKPGVFTLTVPTGGGKTLTSLAFALEHARRNGLERVIVVIPFTSVIEQTAGVYREALPAYADQILEHHSAFDESEIAKREGFDALRLAMESWGAPIVVTTAVQFFESLFSDRPSRCRKLHNLARSVIVLDEAQTVPLPVLRPCVTALRELARNYGSSVVLCTATQPALQERPDDPGRSFPGGFRAPVELAPDPPRLFSALRRVTVRAAAEELDDAALAAHLKAVPQVLCIVNQRAHARELFGTIRDLSGARHLSTCMHAAHRSRALTEIRANLKAGVPCRVVATSLVEAGVDVDFPMVLRAEAGLDSVAQAAGRCNREGRRTAEESEVLVFRAPGREPPRSLRANVEAGAETLRLHHVDPLQPEAVEAYFRLLYWRKGADQLDRHGVLAKCEDERRGLEFPFESIAAAVRLIDDAMAPIIVPVEDEGEAGEWLRSLEFAKYPGGIARRLQRFTVSVPQQVRQALIDQRAAEVIRQREFGDQFVRLANLDLYRSDVGLDWSDPTFIAAERLMV